MTFKDDIDTDLGVMLDDSEFGSEITYTPAAGGSFTVNAIFDNEYIGVDVGENSPVITDQRPVIWIRDSDFSALPVPGDTLAVNSVNYKVIERQPDGTGLSILILDKI